MMGTMQGSNGYGNEIDSLGMGFDRMSLGHNQLQHHQHNHQLAHHQQPQLNSFRPVDHLRHTQSVDGNNRRRGVTKFFNSSKGFGFVVDSDPAALGGQEVFCHFSAISGKGGFRSLAEGEEVEYELVQGPKGFQAANLTGPGGRDVVGDPKARLVKAPPYMQFAPLSIPYMTGGDPYQQQHPGVYAASPYTQHVVYVPTTISGPPTNYAYNGPNALNSSVRTGPPGGANAAFGYNHQPYAPPGPYIATGASYPTPASSRVGSGAYASLTGPASGPSSGPSSGLINGAGRGGGPAYANSPPSRFNAPGSPPGPSSGPSFGFAPFSPPTFNHASLYSEPSASKQTNSFGLPPPSGNGSRAPSASIQSVGGFGSASPSALFGAGTASSNASSGGMAAIGGDRIPSGPIGAPRSNAGTPLGGRGTPGLGNGSLPTPGGSSNSSAFAAGPSLLYASS